MKITTYCSVCRKQSSADSADKLASVASCHIPGRSRDLSSLTIIVEEGDVGEFVKELAKDDSAIPSLKHVTSHLSNLPKQSRILFLLIYPDHVLVFAVSSREFERSARVGDGMSREAMNVKEDSIICYIARTMRHSGQPEGSHGEREGLFPIEDLISDDDPCLQNTLLSASSHIHDDGVVEVEFPTTETGLSDFERRETFVRSSTARVLIDPAEPARLTCRVCDTTP